MNLRTHEPFSDKFRLIYLQLPLFQKEAEECETDFERWIYVLKNMETLNRLPFAAQNSVFQKLASITDVAALSKQERRVYDESLRRYRDTVIVMEGQRAERRAEGRAEGRAEAMLETARKMKAKGISASDIADITLLPINEIEAL